MHYAAREGSCEIVEALTEAEGGEDLLRSLNHVSNSMLFFYFLFSHGILVVWTIHTNGSCRRRGSRNH